MKPLKIFINCAGAILLGASLIRFIIAAGDAQALALREPLLGIVSLRYAVLITGGVELAVALICLFGKATGFQLALLAWLSVDFIAYQIGLRWEHVQPQGTFMGSLTDPLHLARGLSGYLVALLPFCFVSGSFGSGFWFALSKTARNARQAAAKQLADQHDAAAGLLKMPCPSCGGNIKFDSQNLGQKLPCPHCQAVVILRQSENLKMSCYFCKEHIEFPAHALGQKLKCPHCKVEITLKEPG